jgi:hypothetical protein
MVRGGTEIAADRPNAVDRRIAMTRTGTDDGIVAFFESYRRAFEALDSAAIANHFAYPCHMTSDAGHVVLVPITTKDEWTGEIDPLLETYRGIGFVSATVVDLSTSDLSPRVVHAVVHWALHDGAGNLLYDFNAMYTLALIDGAFKITALAHDEILRARVSTK